MYQNYPFSPLANKVTTSIAHEELMAEMEDR
jgi:hypothetical protein